MKLRIQSVHLRADLHFHPEPRESFGWKPKQIESSPFMGPQSTICTAEKEGLAAHRLGAMPAGSTGENTHQGLETPGVPQKRGDAVFPEEFFLHRVSWMYLWGRFHTSRQPKMGRRKI